MNSNLPYLLSRRVSPITTQITATDKSQIGLQRNAAAAQGAQGVGGDYELFLPNIRPTKENADLAKSLVYLDPRSMLSESLDQHTVPFWENGETDDKVVSVLVKREEGNIILTLCRESRDTREVKFSLEDLYDALRGLVKKLDELDAEDAMEL